MGKLTDEQKIEIVKKYQTGEFTAAFLGREYGVSHTSILSLIKVRKIIPRKSKFTVNEHYFDTIDNEEKAYFLGLLYADGCNLLSSKMIEIKLQDRDKEILEKFNLAVNSNRDIIYIDIKTKHPTWQDMNKLRISSLHMCESLARLGCVPQKSMVLEFPNENQVPINLVRHFLRGFWDGDGTFGIYYIKNQKVWRACANIITTSMFCERVGEIIKDELGLQTWMYEPHKKRKVKNCTRRLALCGNKQTYKLINWLYSDCSIFLKRKYDKFKEMEYKMNSLSLI